VQRDLSEPPDFVGDPDGLDETAPRPRRNLEVTAADVLSVPGARNPITGIAGCRARCEWPSRRAAEKRDEFAAFHGHLLRSRTTPYHIMA
jgi:hypothetical protein